ncbi:hypothetical protein ScPMuIL_008788 [Solemya velum]
MGSCMVIVALILLVLGTLISIICVFLPHWHGAKDSSVGSWNAGLWQRCYNESAVCSELPEVTLELAFVRLLVILTIILAIVATVLLLPFEKKTVWDIMGGLVGLLAGISGVGGTFLFKEKVFCVDLEELHLCFHFNYVGVALFGAGVITTFISKLRKTKLRKQRHARI